MRRRWPVCCAFMATLSCAGLRHLDITVGPVSPRPARLLAVYPVELRFEAPAYRSFELSSDLVDAALATGRLMVVGPAEFQVLDRAHNSLYGGTDLSGKLGALRLKPSMVVGLRTWIERREQRGSQQLYDAAGKPRGQARSAEVTYVVHEDLIGPDADEPLIEGSAEALVDPFGDHPPADEAPELREAVKALFGELLRRIASGLNLVPQVTRPPFDADWVPWVEERFAMPGRPALQAQLSAMDPVSAEATRLLRLSYFEPDLAAERQNAMLALPAGLWVRDASGKIADAGLRAGDLITHVEDEHAVGPQTFPRWASVEPIVNVRVLRDGAVVKLRIPSQ